MALITDLDDRTLVERHRAGDPEAFHGIVVRHHRSLYRNALHRLRDPAAAEDAVQDAFIRAFRNLERFDGDYHLDAWLHRILTNTCHDIGRRRGRDTRLFDRACTEVDVDVPAADEAFDATPVEQITAALDSLPESYREVLILRFVEELSYADVADKAGISEENARARVSRGRNMLKRMLTSTSALLVWAIPPLRRQAQLSGAEAEAANHAAAQVHGLATIAASAPAPTQAFNQLSGIIAQAGPTIATAAPAVTSAGPAFKAAMAVGLAASVAIPAVAVDRAQPEEKRTVDVAAADQSPQAVDAPVAVQPVHAAPSSTVPAAPSAGDVPPSPVPPAAADPGPVEPEASLADEAPPAEQSEPGPLGPTDDGAATPTATPAPAAGEQPATEPQPEPQPEPVPTTPGQLSAALSLTPVGDHYRVSGPLKLEIGERVLDGTLTGKLDFGPRDAEDPQAPVEVERSVLQLELADGTVATLSVRGEALVTSEEEGERYELSLTFTFDGPEDLELADEGSLKGTFLEHDATADLGLAIPGAPKAA